MDSLFPDDEPSPLLEAFREFHAANPGVYVLSVRFAREARSKGRERLSAYMIRERIRWYTMVETTGDDFKLNNNFTPFYARLVMDDHPELRGLFELRRAAADEVSP